MSPFVYRLRRTCCWRGLLVLVLLQELTRRPNLRLRQR